MKIEAYTTSGCSYCDHLKELLLRADLKDSTTFIKVGRDIKSHEGMIFGSMYRDWKTIKGYDED